MKWHKKILEDPYVIQGKNLLSRIQEHEVTALAAQSTYYMVLSFFPFLIFIITMISYTPLLTQEIIYELEPFLPQETFQLVMDNVQSILESRSGALLSTGMLVTVFLASNGVAALVKGINKAYRTDKKRPFWKARGLAILLTLALSLLISLSLLLLVFGQLIGTYVFDMLGIPDLFKEMWEATRIAVSLAAMIIMFTFFYKISPLKKVTLRESLPGAVFTTIGWLVLSYGFSSYVNHFGNYSVTYGSIGAIIVLLIWLYLSSVVIILGGEINAWRISENHKQDANAQKYQAN